MNEERNCLNCENFRQHYVKHKTGFTTVDGYGHCGHSRMLRTDVHKRICEKADCKYWQPAEPHEKECNEYVKKTLIRICHELEKILPLLQDEN